VFIVWHRFGKNVTQIAAAKLVKKVGSVWKILEDIGRSWKRLEARGRYWKRVEDIGSAKKFWLIFYQDPIYYI